MYQLYRVPTGNVFTGLKGEGKELLYTSIVWDNNTPRTDRMPF